MFHVSYNSLDQSSARSSSSMCWCRRIYNKDDSAGQYRRLAAAAAEVMKVPRGCVPVLVGKVDDDDDVEAAAAAERFVVKVKVLKDPRIAALLEKGAEQFGERQAGILRIPCDADQFRRVLNLISSAA